MASQTFDPQKAVLWKLNAGQLAVCVVAIFSAGVTSTTIRFSISGVADSVADVRAKLESIDKEGPKATQGLVDRVSKLESYATSIDKEGPAYAQRNNFAGRITRLETRVDTIDQTGTVASQRGAQESEVTRANERRITALEANMAQLLPAVKEIQVNTQWLMKQQKQGDK